MQRQIIMTFIKDMVQMKDNKKDLLRVLLGVSIIAVLILGVNLIYHGGEMAYSALFKKKIRIEFFRERLISEVKRMNSVILAAQNTPKDFATIFEFHHTTEEEIKILIQSVLFNNEEICGCAVAFEPYSYNKDSVYFSMSAFTSHDSLKFSDLNGDEYNYFYKDWYLIPKTLNQPVWSEPFYDSSGDNMLISTYSVPIYQFVDRKEKFTGVVTIKVSIEWLADAVASVGRILQSKAALISENGTILAAPNRALIYNETIFTVAEQRHLPMLREIGREIRQGKSGFKKGFDGDTFWYIFYSAVATNKWGMILFVSEDELMETGKETIGIF